MKVEREPYTGPVIDLTKGVENCSLSPSIDNGLKGASFHNRPLSKSGVRNQQDSSFSFSGKLKKIMIF
jgi:hypothetical protein